jgi:hypothetical protein
VTAEPLPPERAAGHLRDMATDVRAAVLVRPDGSPAGDDERAAELAGLTGELLAAVDDALRGERIDQVEAHTERGSIFAVRRDGWTLAAVARRSALPSLMFYDLRTTLERVRL